MKILGNEAGAVNLSPRDFLQWEQASRQSLDVKLIYIDMAGDLVAGFVLSQIVYWHLPGKDGGGKLRVKHDGHLWIAKARGEWWDECRVSARQIDRVIKILEEKKLVETITRKFQGDPKLHVRLNWEEFLNAWQEQVGKKETDISDWESGLHESVKTTFTDGIKPSSPNGEDDFTPAQTPCTENTAKSTQRQQQHDVVDSQNNVSSVERHTPEYSQLLERLVQLRVLPDRAPYLIERYGERVAAALDWWESNPDYLASRDSPGGAVAASIETPAKYPQVYSASAKNGSTPAAPKKPRQTKAARRENQRAAYETIWNNLAAPLREALEREGKEMFEYVEAHCADELARVLRSGKS